MSIQVTCGFCSTCSQVDDRAAGKVLKCPECDEPLRVPSLTETRESLPDVAPVQIESPPSPAPVLSSSKNWRPGTTITLLVVGLAAVLFAGTLASCIIGYLYTQQHTPEHLIQGQWEAWSEEQGQITMEFSANGHVTMRTRNRFGDPRALDFSYRIASPNRLELSTNGITWEVLTFAVNDSALNIDGLLYHRVR